MATPGELDSLVWITRTVFQWNEFRPSAGLMAGLGSEFVPLKKSEVGSFTLLHKISWTICCFWIRTFKTIQLLWKSYHLKLRSSILSAIQQNNQQSARNISYILQLCCALVRNSGFPRTRENGKRPWIWNFVPGREKARNFGLESWKLTCDWENWFYEFCLTNEVLVTETQALVCCSVFAKFTNLPSFYRKFWTQWVPVSYQSMQRPELTDGQPSLFRTCAQSWNAAATKFDKHGNFEARQVL